MIYDMSVPVTSVQEGHDLVMSEAQKRWPGLTIQIISESDDGVYKARVLVEDTPPSAPDPQNYTLHVPRFIIVLTGDAHGFGESAVYNDSKPPFRIATKGDSEDHRNMDAAWSSAITGDGEIWSSYLSLKYRTDTVLLKNKNAQGYVIEQNGSSVVCDGEPTQANITDCLTN